MKYKFIAIIFSASLFISTNAYAGSFWDIFNFWGDEVEKEEQKKSQEKQTSIEQKNKKPTAVISEDENPFFNDDSCSRLRRRNGEC